MEVAGRASLAEAEAHQIRVTQIAAGASSSPTVEIVDDTVVVEDTTEDVQIAEDVGSGEPDPPAC